MAEKNNKWYHNVNELTEFANDLAQAGILRNVDDLEHMLKNPEKYNDAFYFYKEEIMGEKVESTKADFDNYSKYLSKLGIDKIIVIQDLDNLSDNLESWTNMNINEVKDIKLFLLRNIILLGKHIKE